MKSITIRDWVAALRSGQYLKGTDALRSDGDGPDGYVTEHYCCLGVAAQVAGALDDYGCLIYQWYDDEVGLGGFGSDEGEFRGLPYYDLEAASDDKNLMHALIEMNDGTGSFRDNRKTFSEIADYIEANCDLDAVIRFQLEEPDE